MKESVFNHVGIIVRDLDAAASFLVEVFGLTPAGVDPSPGVRARFFNAGPVTIQLVEDERRLRGSPIARLDHICLDVDDIDEVMAAAGRFDTESVWEEPLEHHETSRAQFLTDRGGLGIVVQLNDDRGDGTGRRHTKEDQDRLSRIMARGDGPSEG